MINTLAEAKPFCAPYVEDGKASTDPIVVDVINEATQLLIQEAHWSHLVKKLAVATYNNTLALPQDVETVLAVDFDYCPSQVHSMWYEFLDGGPGLLVGDNNACRDMLMDLGDGHPTFFDIGPSEMKVAAFSTEAADVGKNIRIRGIDEDRQQVKPTVPGEVIRVQRWQDGVEGQIDGSNLTLSTNPFFNIESVVKDVTSGYVTLLAIDRPPEESAWNMHKLAKYGPRETNPGYRRYRITNSAYTDQEWITMLVKTRYIPMYFDTDVLPIQSLHALRYMCKAIHHFNHGRAEEGAQQQSLAMRFLDKMQSNAHPPTNEINVDVRLGTFSRGSNLV